MNLSIALRDSSGEKARSGLRSYATGLVLALILTFAAFGAVMSGVLPSFAAAAAIAALALVQVVVHLVYFLHMNGSPRQRWNLTALVYAALMGGILVGGSFWIMYHLNHNMMPMPMG